MWIIRRESRGGLRQTGRGGLQQTGRDGLQPMLYKIAISPKKYNKNRQGRGYIIICIVAATEISILSDKFRPDSPPKILSNFQHSVVLHRSLPKMLSESAQERKKYNILGILQDNIPLPRILPQNVTFNRQAYRQHRHSTAIEHIGSHGIPGAAWARRRPAKTTKKRRQKRRYVKGRPARED